MRADKKQKMVLFIKQHMEIWLVLALTAILSISMLFVKQEQEITIDKEGYDGDSRQIGFILKKEEATEEMILELRPRKLTKEQTEKQMKEAFAYLDTHMKGDNTSLSHVVTDLDFSLDLINYPFNLEVEPTPYILIEQDGRVRNKREELKAFDYSSQQQEQGIPVSLKIILRYGEYYQDKEYALVIFPKGESSLEKQFFKVKEVIENKEQEALYDRQLILPTSIEGVQIAKAEDSKPKPLHIALIGFLIAGLLLLREQENQRMREKKKQEKLLKCYPWFVNEVVLLFGAGMQMKAILATLIGQYEAGKSNKRIGQEDDRVVLIEELKRAYHSLELGMSEEQVYYQMGRRIKLSCYIKLMTLLEQNVKRGAKGLTAAFEQEETYASEERKNLARRYGEEAGTKLLGPMILLLLVVMLMIMVPAFMSFA